MFNKKKIMYSLGGVAALTLTASTVISCSYDNEINSLKNITKQGLDTRFEQLKAQYKVDYGNKKAETIIADVFYLEIIIKGVKHEDMTIIQLIEKPKYDYQQVFGSFQAEIINETTIKITLLALRTIHYYYDTTKEGPQIGVYSYLLTAS